MKIVFATFGVKLGTSVTITDLKSFEAPKIRCNLDNNKVVTWRGGESIKGKDLWRLDSASLKAFHKSKETANLSK